MAAFASSYGTFVQIAPASPPPPEEGSSGGSGWGWVTGTGASGMSSSSSSITSSSPPPPPRGGSGSSTSLPIHYRCLLLVDNAAAAGAGIVGVRLGWGRGRLLRVAAVLSESVMGVCQVAEGDVVTHVNGESVAGMDEEGAGLLLLGSRKQRRAVVELRLIRARSLPALAQDEDEEDEEASTVAAAYARLQGPMLLYEAHARDTLPGVASRFKTTAQTLRSDNRELFPPGESVPPAVQPGLLLRIRNPDYTAGAGGVSPPWATPERSRSGLAVRAAAAGAAGGGGGLVQRRCYHLVAGGETLEGIARRYGVVSVMDIRRWNRGLFPVGEARAAMPGDRLLLFCSSSSSRGPVEAAEEKGDGVGKTATKQQGGKRRGGGGGGSSRSAPIAIAAAGGCNSGDSRSSSGATPSPE